MQSMAATTLARAVHAGGLLIRGFRSPSSARALSAATSNPFVDERDHLPETVYVPEGGRRVSTPDMPDVIRHSLTDPDPAPRHSMSDPRYTYTKTFGGWDPRSFGNSLGSSMRDPPYDVTTAPPPHLATRRVARRG